MYDKTQEPNEFTGESAADATQEAARFFGLEEADLKVVVAADGAISGAAGRTVVVAFPKNVTPKPPGAPGGGDEERGRGRGRESKERGRDRGGRDRGGRGRRDREGGGGRETRHEQASEEARADATPEESKGTAKGQLGPVGDFLIGTVERMVQGPFELAESTEGDFLIYQLTGEASERLGGSDGRPIDALQLLANQVAKDVLDDSPRIVIDVAGEMADREDSLKRLSERASGRARETGRSVALDPMNSRDRRVVHMALKEEDALATMSIGTGRYRQVLVVPEGAPEYEEATESVKQSS